MFFFVSLAVSGLGISVEPNLRIIKAGLASSSAQMVLSCSWGNPKHARS
jgi:hypothetical protein